MSPAVVPICLIVLSEAAFALHHAVWASPWWREPLVWTDRWHVLSGLAHFPIVTYVLVRCVPSGRHAWRWLAVIVGCEAVWWLIKALAGKGHWPMWWLQALEWLT